MGSLSRWPVVGTVVKASANWWARRQHSGFALTREEAEKIIDASPYIAVGKCSCREVFHNCDAPVLAEVAVGFGKEIYADSGHAFRAATREEAKALLDTGRERGLMPLAVQCRGHYYAICQCCKCCCVPYRLKKNYGIELAIVRDTSIVQSFTEQLESHRL